MNDTEMPACPECEKLKEVSPKSQLIGEFLEWLNDNQRIVLCKYEVMRSDELVPIRTSIENLLARYYKIDMDKVEKERIALLDYIRGNQ